MMDVFCRGALRPDSFYRAAWWIKRKGRVHLLRSGIFSRIEFRVLTACYAVCAPSWSPVCCAFMITEFCGLTILYHSRSCFLVQLSILLVIQINSLGQ